MSTNRMQIYKSVFLAAFIVFFLGSFFSGVHSCRYEQERKKALYDETHQEQLSSVDTFLRIEMVSRTSRSVNRFNFNFNSLPAVLFKIAEIPSSSNNISVVIMAELGVLQALGKILRFVHDSDGKKGGGYFRVAYNEASRRKK